MHRQTKVVNGAPRKNVRTGKHAALDAAVMKWYVQQRSVGMNVHGIEILAAARKLAQKIEVNFEVFEAEYIHRLLQCGGQTGPSVDDVRDWLDEQENDPGDQVMTENDIVASVTNPEENSSEDKVPVNKVKLSTLRTYIDALLDYTTYSTIPETSSHYGSLRMLRELMIKEQHQGGRQTKVTHFFSPVTSS